MTGASALITETLVVAEEYHRLSDWDLVKESLIKNNLLNKIKQSTFNREYSEIKKRINNLSDQQIALMVSGDLDEAKSMILLSILKSYDFFKDFMIEVLGHKFQLFDRFLDDSDYNRFINYKNINHPELLTITPETASKVKQVIFKILEQLGIITSAKNGTIIKPMLSAKSIEVIINDDPNLLSGFLYSHEEIKNIKSVTL
jgi:predicted transcriptional regulator